MAVIRRIEDFYRRMFCGSKYLAAVPASERNVVSRANARKAMPLPVFRGFEDDRYQAHDAPILKLTADFNANKILSRAKDPDAFVPIEIKLAK